MITECALCNDSINSNDCPRWNGYLIPICEECIIGLTIRRNEQETEAGFDSKSNH